VRAHRGCRDALEAFLEDAAVPREDHLARAEHPLKGGFSLVCSIDTKHLKSAY
jgi:hypothetical protein